MSFNNNSQFPVLNKTTNEIRSPFTAAAPEASVNVPSAVLPAGGFRVAAALPSVPPRVQSLVSVDVLLKAVEARLGVLCCAAAGVTEGVLRQRERDVAFVTSAVWRHRGSLFWRNNHR